MKFLCVGYYDQQKMDALSEAQVDAVMSECPPFMEEFYGSGKVFLEAGVDAQVKVLRRIGGEVNVTDGEVSVSHERVGCVFLVEASDIAEAVRVASLHPTTRLAAGEALGFRLGISPVRHFEDRKLRK
jgi:hypothetical protein